MEKQRPQVGVAVIVIKEGKILLGKRKNAHGEGNWSAAGGHLEFGESVEACARRELSEETGLEALSLELGSWTENSIDQKHYLTFFALVREFTGEPKLLEPNKCEGWQWFSLDALPAPLFPTIKSLIEKIGISKLKGNSSDISNEGIKNLLDKLNAFYKERSWDQFHSPKNLVMNLASEIGELIEHFRWITEKASYEMDEKTLEDVKDEIGDVFQVLIHFSDKLGIDPLQAAHQKHQKIAQKYPAKLSKGKALKYTAYEGNHS